MDNEVIYLVQIPSHIEVYLQFPAIKDLYHTKVITPLSNCASLFRCTLISVLFHAINKYMGVPSTYTRVITICRGPLLLAWWMVTS